MSFKFPSFDLKSIQESLPTVDLLRESFSKVDQQFKDSIQPFTNKTQQLLNEQLKQVQQLASNVSALPPNIEVSELPKDYLELEVNCDLLLKLYTELIQSNNSTYGQLSYDYPPGNTAFNKLKDAHIGDSIGAKFNQLKNVSSPQELEKVLLGQASKDAGDDEEEGEEGEDRKAGADGSLVTIQPTSGGIPRTLFGHLSEILAKQSEELQAKSEELNPLSFVLLQISSTYHEIAAARLVQDDKIIKGLNNQLVEILNQQFIKVNELRKKVYLTRSQFDQLRSKHEATDPENEELIAKEDELVSATELAVIEMKKILKPSKNINLLKIMVQAQKEYFETSAKKLNDLLANLDKVKPEEEDDDDEEEEEEDE
ncbi:conserved hypothetical protein [Lodderomyces elongisporus NRRL YB-4239]|uniref:Protein GVP36 n=1 Tax=Lodderomyces elongisporus (strain ATCC 11503 / CBS 2605 / JCM 1781 / NBRC 1676 / NRRL YB-4239) TaxID=379508 RepID=A5DTV0_LODEL|nr:conserved hypothetical protein [Lodderomyces elongisporus NRRL YB-4239]